MKKILIAAAGVLLALPMAASASVNFNTLSGITFNGKADLTGVNAVDANANIAVKFEVLSTSDSDFNGACLDWVGDFVSAKLADGCRAFDENTQSGTYPIEMTIPAPGPSGTHDFVLTLYGVDGVGQDFDQNSSNQVASWTVNDRVAVKQAGSTNTGTGVPAEGSMAWFQAQVLALTGQISCMTSGGTWNAGTCTPKPAPVVSDACTRLNSKLMGTQYNARSSQNGILQGFLIGEGMSIPLLQNNQATYGFWGSQTNDALNMFKSVYKCV